MIAHVTTKTAERLAAACAAEGRFRDAAVAGGDADHVRWCDEQLALANALRSLAANRDALLADLDAAREALAEIEQRHIPDQPAADNCDELTWAQKHVGRLRKIARVALDRLEGKP